jgi:two-component system sensor histidine kinase DesK
MTASIPPRWLLRHPHWPLMALHVPLTLQVPVYTILGMDAAPGNPVFAIVGSAAAGAIQLRHSLAAARGERPAGWPWSLAAIVLLADLPIWWLGSNWEAFGIFALASMLTLLRGRWVLAAATALQLTGNATREVVSMLQSQSTIPQAALLGMYAVVATALYAAALVGGARLVRLLNELEAARTELAATAVGEERIRISRDLHDLLGQSLSAISLKGDLALRLLARDTTAARAEIESLTGVARDALHDVRAITGDRHTVSLRTEIDGAAALLGAAGVDTRLDLADLPSLPASAQSALAWAIREGTTNLLRHSRAGSCTITLSRQRGRVRLEIINDGVAGQGSPHGSGIAGVAERAKAASGSSEAGVHDGRFRLWVEVPEEVA